jgi:hypothetical protein
MHINGAVSGGGGNPDLVSGGAPTNGSQAKPGGTTSSDAITFQAPTGGSGSSTPSAALAHVVGSGASLSGSGLGPYTVSSLTNNDVVTVTCTHTDDGDGQVVKDVATVSVAGGAGGGVAYPDTLLDWSASSETFAAGAGAYTIGGLSVTYSLAGTSGPTSIGLVNGVLTVVCGASEEAYLVVDLGVDVTDETVVAYCTSDSVSAGGSSAILFMLSTGTNIGNAANQFQASVGHAGTETTILVREANSPSNFTNIESLSVTDISTTPTRICLTWDGASGTYSYDQGSATLPTDGDNLATTGANVNNDGSGAVTRQNRRYVHLWIKTSGTYRIGAALRRITP